MQKIFQYIKNGKGNGLLFLLATAVIISIFSALTLKQIYTEVHPQIMLVADEFLPITVTNGKITSPEETYKRIDLSLGDKEAQPIPIVLDTRSETTGIPQEKFGIFLLKDTLYIVNDIKIERVQLPDGVIDKTVFEQTLDKFVGALSLIIAVITVLFIFVINLIKTLILVGLAHISQKMSHKDMPLPFSALMRLSSIIIAPVALIAFALNIAGIAYLNALQQVIIGLVFVWLYLRTNNHQNP